MIHPTAVIDPKAEIEASTVVGPYAVIDAGVTLGPRCHVGPHVHITGQTRIGADNRFSTGAVIGEAPQDIKYDGAATALEIGDGNIFREHVTVHRSNHVGEPTRIGSRNFFMAGSHVGHNCLIGNEVIVANTALLAGHVEIADRAFISGSCLVHQFVRIGTLSMMRGGAGVSKDLPPFTMAAGVNSLCGLNIIGLRRAGISSQDRLELKRLYRHLFRGGIHLTAALDLAGSQFTGRPALDMLAFISTAKRGICFDSRRGRAEEIHD